MTVLTTVPNRYVLMADISQYQQGARLDDHRAAGFEVLSFRSQYGGRFIDPQFDNFATAALEVGLKRLYYVWVQPFDSADAHIRLMREAQARHGAPELGWMLDVEDTSNTLSPAAYRTLVLQLAAEAVRLTSKLPVIYTAAWYWDNHLAGVDDLADCPLFVASYPFQDRFGQDLKPPPAHFTGYGNWAFGLGDRGANAVPRSGGWEQWTGWQFTSVAGLEVPGFVHRGVRGLDLNLVRPEWIAQRLAGGNQPPPPPAGDEPVLKLIQFAGRGEVFLGPWYAPGLLDTVRWIGPDQLVAYQPFLGDIVQVDPAAIRNVTCVGRVPAGDWPFLHAEAGQGVPGPQGPAGPAGSPGPAGVPGPAGAPGATAAQVADELGRRIVNG